MLNSKRDLSIRRYLSNIGKMDYSSRNFQSKYWEIDYGSNVKIRVRFSDHFADVTKEDINIVRTSVGFYVIRLSRVGVSYTVTEDAIMAYLRSIFLTYPEVSGCVESYKKATDSACKKAIKVASDLDKTKAKLKKRDDYIDMVDSVYDENKEFRSKIESLSKELESVKKSLETATKAAEDYKQKYMSKCSSYTSLYGKVQKLESIFKSIK